MPKTVLHRSDPGTDSSCEGSYYIGRTLGPNWANDGQRSESDPGSDFQTKPTTTTTLGPTFKTNKTPLSQRLRRLRVGEQRTHCLLTFLYYAQQTLTAMLGLSPPNSRDTLYIHSIITIHTLFIRRASLPYPSHTRGFLVYPTL